jgi:cell pole-organizing protein PopZ
LVADAATQNAESPMSEQKTQQEPTMEEILASIRRIISEDGEEGGEKPAPKAAEPPAAAAAPATDAPVTASPAAAAPADDVLELTQMVADDGSVVSLAGAPAQDDIAVEDDEPLAIEPRPSFGPAMGGDLPPPLDDEDDWAAPPLPASPGEGLLSPDAAALANAAFQRVGSLLTSGPGGPQTVEDLVRELLKPMLKAWLDENLPPMVERMVAAEIARVSGRGPR